MKLVWSSLFIMCALHTTCLAQLVGIQDLIKISTFNADQTENFLIRRNLNYDGVHRLNTYLNRITYNQSKGMYFYRSVSLTIYNQVETMDVSYSTTSVSEFITLKKQISDLGYSFLEGVDEFKSYINKNDSKIEIKTGIKNTERGNLYVVYIDNVRVFKKYMLELNLEK